MLLIEPNVLRLQVDNYFEQVKTSGKFNVGVIEYDEPVPTLTGLAIFLGFTTVGHFKTYMEREEYREHIEYAMLRIENRYEKLLQAGNKGALVGLKKVGEWSGEPTVTQVGVNVNNGVSNVALEDRIALIKSLRAVPKGGNGKEQSDVNGE
jgi:hypothetical protein